MSMGYGSASATIIDEQVLAKVCPNELKAFLDLVESNDEYDIDSELFASDLVCGEVDEAMDKAYTDLCNAFENTTKLSLEFAVHDCDNSGDAYDDVDGHFWCVDNVYQKTPEAIEFEKQFGSIQNVSYVQFG